MSERRAPKATKWKPKKWRPEYERIVAFSCVGWSAKMIKNKLDAEGVGFTVQHIYNILNLEEAEKIRIALLERMREKTVVDIPTQMEYIATKTMQRVRTMVDSDELFEKSPFAVIDRGMKVVEGLGHFKAGKEAGSVNFEKAIIFNASRTEQFLKGSELADAVKLLEENATP